MLMVQQETTRHSDINMQALGSLAEAFSHKVRTILVYVEVQRAGHAFCLGATTHDSLPRCTIQTLRSCTWRLQSYCTWMTRLLR